MFIAYFLPRRKGELLKIQWKFFLLLSQTMFSCQMDEWQVLSLLQRGPQSLYLVGQLGVV